MTTITDLSSRILAFRDERDWKQFHKPKDMAISLVLEAGEVMEHFQWKTNEEVDAYVATHKGEIADELADVLNYVMMLASDLNIDLAEAVVSKLKKSAVKYPVAKAKGSAKKYTELT